MKDSILFVSVQSIPLIEYDKEITLKDLLIWKDKLKDLGVDLMKVIVYANLEMFSALQRSLLQAGVGWMSSAESIIPFTVNQHLPIQEQLQFTGINVFQGGEIVMKVFVYEVYNDYYLNSRKGD